jgi:hypothetical protein
VFAACNAIADTSGMTLTPETVWIRLVPTVAVEGKATLLLDFSKPVSDLTNETSAADLAGIFTFKNGENTSGAEKIKPTKISKDSEAVYTLFVENVPDGGAGTVLLTITKPGIAPPTRAWSLDGEVYEISLSRSDTGAALDDTHPFGDEASISYLPFELSVTITNNGSTPTGELNITLSEDDALKFSLSQNIVDSIAVGQTATFSVQPEAELPPDTLFTSLVTVSGNGIAEHFRVNFTVKLPLTSSATTLPGGTAQHEVGSIFDAEFHAVAKDADGNSYAAGRQGVWDAGCSGGSNEHAIIAKFDSAGDLVWIKKVGEGTYGHSGFYGVAVDGSGVYTVGYLDSEYGNDFGNGITGTSNGPSRGATIVKYDSAGVAQWVIVSVDAANAEFSGVAADGSGNVYAVGWQHRSNNGSISYGEASALSTNTDRGSSVIVKFTDSGQARWAKTVDDANAEYGGSEFRGVAADSAGNVYAAGFQRGNEEFDYYGATVRGSAVRETSGDNTANAVLVKYDGETGAAVWAKSSTLGSEASAFNGVAVDGLGNVYAAGYQSNSGAFTYSGQTVSGPYNITEMDYSPGKNALLVKFAASGEAIWAKSLLTGGDSCFYAVAANARCDVYAAGVQTGSGTFNYDTAAPASDYASGENAVIVKYNSAGGTGAVIWARAVNGGNNDSQFYAVAVDDKGAAAAAGYQHGTGSFNYGDSQSAAAAPGTSADNENAVVVGYK